MPTSPGAILLDKMVYHTQQIRRLCISTFKFGFSLMTHSASSRVIKSFSRIASSSLKKVAEFSKIGIQKLMEKIQTADFFEKFAMQKLSNTHFVQIYSVLK